MAFRLTSALAFRVGAAMGFRVSPAALRTGSMNEWAYNMAGFNRYGLYRDDCLYEDDDVVEALRRLPKHVVDERNYRCIRAIQLDIQRKQLPKKEWIKYEDDILYLTPVVEQVKKERAEREKWDSEY